MNIQKHVVSKLIFIIQQIDLHIICHQNKRKIKKNN